MPIGGIGEFILEIFMKKITSTVTLLFMVLFAFFGCMTNPYTNQPAELDSNEAREATAQYKSEISRYKQNGLLLTDTELGQQVVAVANNLIAAAKKWERTNNKGKLFPFRHSNSWEVNFVDDPEWNAWCMAGGKICVYAGLLYGPAAIQTEDELAAILGHEIAHALLFHIKREKDYEKQRSEWGLGKDKTTAYSRAMETEADKVGLTLMAIAGYDGNAAADIWEKMATNEGYYDEYNASHPADWRRAENLRKELPKSQKIARKIGQGKKAVQFIAPTVSLGAGVMTGIQPAAARKHNPVESLSAGNLFKAWGSDIFYGAGLKASLETTMLGLSFSTPNQMEDWLGSAYLKYNFRFGTSAENIFSPFGGVEFSGGYFGGIFGANIDKKLVDRLYLRGQVGWRIFNYGENTSSVVQNGLPIFMLGAGAVWAVK